MIKLSKILSEIKIVKNLSEDEVLEFISLLWDKVDYSIQNQISDILNKYNIQLGYSDEHDSIESFLFYTPREKVNFNKLYQDILILKNKHKLEEIKLQSINKYSLIELVLKMFKTYGDDNKKSNIFTKLSDEVKDEWFDIDFFKRIKDPKQLNQLYKDIISFKNKHNL